ncbi:hypothetical protein RHSIM_Rhsim06G0035300 [Rhododendron simsii]|uniref:Uncharacterized protein n=1 Tax=Rhododendron simsii TaxID=118357 RepID=A0A834GT88_RHOSS|nr:hypothetical protein RHSIM_Rhsim06G0035300 [Rhododendron simsii]
MMASSTSPSNSDLPRQQQQLSSSIHSHSLAEGSMNMDDILRNIYTDDAHTVFPNKPFSAAVFCGGVSNKMVEEIWKEIVTGGGRSRELP